MDWISIKDSLPEEGTRVLTFSPAYSAVDAMCYRLMDGQFVEISAEITHWAYLKGPDQSEN